MKTTVLQVRLDEQLKQQAEAILNDIGLSTTAAVRFFFAQTVRRNGLPFDPVSADPFYSEENQKAIRESIAQLEAGKVVVVNKLLDDE